jgi:hypothetical protein
MTYPLPDEPEVSGTREDLWNLLENADVPQYLIELVDKVVETLEWGADRECPVCEERYARELAEHDRLAEEYMNSQQLPRVHIGVDFSTGGDFSAEGWIYVKPKPVTFFEVNSEGGRFGRIRWHNRNTWESWDWGKVYWDRYWPTSVLAGMLSNIRWIPIDLSRIVSPGRWMNINIARRRGEGERLYVDGKEVKQF